MIRAIACALIWLAVAWVEELTPTRALLLAALLEASLPSSRVLPFAVRHGSGWIVFHFLCPDASFGMGAWVWAGAVLAVAAARRWAWCSVLPAAVVLGPLLMTFLFGLSAKPGSDPVSLVSPWTLAGDPLLTSSVGAPPPQTAELPVGFPASGRIASLAWRPPAHLLPFPLASDSFQRTRAWLLVFLLLGLQGFASWRPRRALFCGAGSFLVAATAWSLAHPAAPFLLHWQGSQGSALVSVFPSAQGLWDPADGDLLPPSGAWVLRRDPGGLWQPAGASCWGILQPTQEAESAAVLAWLEWAPLLGSKSGGQGQFQGLLRHWAAGEPDPGERPIRWEYRADGSLHRRPSLDGLTEFPDRP